MTPEHGWATITPDERAMLDVGRDAGWLGVSVRQGVGMRREG